MSVVCDFDHFEGELRIILFCFFVVPAKGERVCVTIQLPPPRQGACRKLFHQVLVDMYC
jgi:hypothetical protein